jgi:hypothetical protein
MRRVLACLLLAGYSHGAALGCINDNESPQHEREFRSQYLAPIVARTTPKADPDRTNRFSVATLGGAVLLGGALVVAWNASQPRS